MRKELKNSFGRSYLTLSHDKANGWIRCQWQGVLAVENVIKGGTEVLELMHETGSRQILNDNRFVIGSWKQANDWIEEEWMPQAIELGLLQFAHVVPAGVFGIASAEEMLSRVHGRFEMRLFKSLDEAKQWLTETAHPETSQEENAVRDEETITAPGLQ